MKLRGQILTSAVIVGAVALTWSGMLPGSTGLLRSLGLGGAATEAAAPGPAGGPAAAPLVIGAPVTMATVNDRFTAIGDGRALRSVTVTPSVSGRVASIEVTAGEQVEAGSVLARLDSEEQEIAVDRALISLEDAQITHERIERLWRSNAVSDVQRREAEIALRRADLEKRDAELALERRTVRAPFAGRVGIVSVNLGDQIDTGGAIATIDDRSEILVDFRAPERLVRQIRLGATLMARPLALPWLELAGEVTAIDSRVNAETRTILVRATIDNADDLLRAGMAFSIQMAFSGDTYPAVDPLAIQWSGDGPYVWVEDAGAARQVPVRIVRRTDAAVLVDADLPVGTQVVTEGVQMLRPGLAVVLEGDGAARQGIGSAASPRPEPAAPAQDI